MSKKLSLFDFLNSINSSDKKDLMPDAHAYQSYASNPDSPEKAYNSFLINRGLSYFQDTILFANEINKSSHLPVRMQYDFLRNGIRPRKRFSKWFKTLPIDKDTKIVMEHYGYNSDKARDALKLLSPSALKALHKLHKPGGKQK